MLEVSIFGILTFEITIHFDICSCFKMKMYVLSNGVVHFKLRLNSKKLHVIYYKNILKIETKTVICPFSKPIDILAINTS